MTEGLASGARRPDDPRSGIVSDSVSDMVFGEVVSLLTEITGDQELLGFEISPATTFHEDLQMESVDLVTFTGTLIDHFGERVDLAAYLSDLELDDIIALTVGQIADYVTGCLTRVDS
jgi:acyl carrier protein